MFATSLDALAFQWVAKIPSFGYSSKSWTTDFLKLVLNSIIHFELPYPRNAFVVAQTYAADGSLPPSFRHEVGEFSSNISCKKFPIYGWNFPNLDLFLQKTCKSPLLLQFARGKEELPQGPIVLVLEIKEKHLFQNRESSLKFPTRFNLLLSPLTEVIRPFSIFDKIEEDHPQLTEILLIFHWADLGKIKPSPKGLCSPRNTVWQEADRLLPKPRMALDLPASSPALRLFSTSQIMNPITLVLEVDRGRAQGSSSVIGKISLIILSPMIPGMVNLHLLRKTSLLSKLSSPRRRN